MKFLLKYLVIYLTFSLLNSGCKTHFRISVKVPATIMLPDSTLNFGIVNAVNNLNSPEKKIEELLNSVSLNGNVTASERAVDGILRALEVSNNSQYYNQPLKGKTTNIATLRNENGIDWNKIDSLATNEKVEAFVELVEIKTVSPVGSGIIPTVNILKPTNNSATSYQLKGTLYVNFYVAHQHISFERYAVQYQYTIPLSGNISIITILDNIQKKKENYRALGYELGYKAGKLIYPNWIWVNRTFYNKGNPELRRAKNMIKKGNWDIAEKQLMYATNRRGRKDLGRTYYNLALIKEGQGDIDKAIEYCEKSALEYRNKLANSYLVDLRNRKIQIDRLE